MSYDTVSEWDEDLFNKASYEEDDASESILQSEKDMVLRNFNQGITYANLNYNDLS